MLEGLGAQTLGFTGFGLQIFGFRIAVSIQYLKKKQLLDFGNSIWGFVDRSSGLGLLRFLHLSWCSWVPVNGKNLPGPPR